MTLVEKYLKEAEIPEHLRTSDDFNEYDHSGNSEPIPFNKLSKDKKREALTYAMKTYSAKFEQWINRKAASNSYYKLKSASEKFLQEKGLEDIIHIGHINPLNRSGFYNEYNSDNFEESFSLSIYFHLSKEEKENLNSKMAGRKFSPEDHYNMREIGNFTIGKLGPDTTIDNVSFYISRTRGEGGRNYTQTFYNQETGKREIDVEKNRPQAEIKEYFINALTNVFKVDPNEVLRELYDVCLKANNEAEIEAGDVYAKRKYFYEVLSHEDEDFVAGVRFADKRETIISGIYNITNPKEVAGNIHYNGLFQGKAWEPSGDILGNN